MEFTHTDRSWKCKCNAKWNTSVIHMKWRKRREANAQKQNMIHCHFHVEQRQLLTPSPDKTNRNVIQNAVWWNSIQCVGSEFRIFIERKFEKGKNVEFSCQLFGSGSGIFTLWTMNVGRRFSFIFNFCWKISRSPTWSCALVILTFCRCLSLCAERKFIELHIGNGSRSFLVTLKKRSASNRLHCTIFVHLFFFFNFPQFRRWNW